MEEESNTRANKEVRVSLMGKGEILSQSIIMFGFRFQVEVDLWFRWRWRLTYGNTIEAGPAWGLYRTEVPLGNSATMNTQSYIVPGIPCGTLQVPLGF